MGRASTGQDSPGSGLEKPGVERGTEVLAESGVSNPGEAAESRQSGPLRKRRFCAASARRRCVTLARSLFSLSHGCLICQVGWEEPPQSVLRRNLWM